MIKVLIVEDEPPIARAVSRMIEGHSPIMKVIGCEINGKDALEHMRAEAADVIFTDIRMPVMDGLKLLQALRAEWPDCLAVILSGHQDFTYAQTALRFGVFDYLLKPLSRDALDTLLDRLERSFARSRLEEAASSWRAGGEMAAAAPEAVPEGNKTYALILALAGQWPSTPDDALSPGAVFWQTHDPDPLMRGMLDANADMMAIVGRAASERVFLLENLAPDSVVTLAEQFYKRLAELSNLPQTLYAAPGPLAFTDIGAVIKRARECVYTNIKLCRPSLLADSGLLHEPVRLSEAVIMPPQPLIEALYVHDMDQIAAAINGAVDAAVTHGATQAAFVQFLEAVVYDRRLQRNTSALKDELIETVSWAVSADSLKTELTQLFQLSAAGESKAEQHELVKRIESYLSAHYTENISNDMLSALFGFVPSYLSKIFKKQTGVSPNEYVTRLRMEKARELLESRPGLLVRDAALFVGFNDPYYFSKLFKKVTGQMPSKYQEN